MKEFLTLFNSWHYGFRVAVLTLYIALVNSYALFVVYPTIKTVEISSIILSLVVYLLLTVPLFLYAMQRFQPRPRRIVLVVGLAVMIVATIIQYFVSHTAVPTLILHLLFYLYAGAVEETLWRGKLWSLINGKTKNHWITLAIVTAHFVVLHIPFALLEKQPPINFLLQVLALGIFLGILRIVTKKITYPAFAHAVINMVVYT
jgi:hypothetical protein